MTAGGICSKALAAMLPVDRVEGGGDEDGGGGGDAIDSSREDAAAPGLQKSSCGATVRPDASERSIASTSERSRTASLQLHWARAALGGRGRDETPLQLLPLPLLLLPGPPSLRAMRRRRWSSAEESVACTPPLTQSSFRSTA